MTSCPSVTVSAQRRPVRGEAFPPLIVLSSIWAVTPLNNAQCAQYALRNKFKPKSNEKTSANFWPIFVIFLSGQSVFWTASNLLLESNSNMAPSQLNEMANHCAIRCMTAATKRTLTSPLGNLKITYCATGLSSLKFESVASDEKTFVVQSGTRVKVIGDYEEPQSVEAEKVLSACLQWLDCYFHQPELLQKIPLPPICWISNDTSFRGNCLRNLGKIAPFGNVVSYSDLAAAAGNSAASRAAGTSMSTNPIAIIIPCHRVITKSGEMGRYGGGVQVKRFLLDFEQKIANGR